MMLVGLCNHLVSNNHTTMWDMHYSKVLFSSGLLVFLGLSSIGFIWIIVALVCLCYFPISMLPIIGNLSLIWSIFKSFLLMWLIPMLILRVVRSLIFLIVVVWLFFIVIVVYGSRLDKVKNVILRWLVMMIGFRLYLLGKFII